MSAIHDGVGARERQDIVLIRDSGHPLVGVVARFHERVKQSCWDPLAGEMLQKHEPHLLDWGPPECWGCDRRTRYARPPYWPCSTYATIAANVLNLSSRSDVTAVLADAITDLSRNSIGSRETG